MYPHFGINRRERPSDTDCQRTFRTYTTSLGKTESEKKYNLETVSIKYLAHNHIPVNKAYRKVNFLISQPKYMLWVLKIYAKIDG